MLSRSASGESNGSRPVEQKDATLVRAYGGDWRVDTVTQIRYLNTLYGLLFDQYSPRQLVMHQVAKKRIAATTVRPT